MAASYRTCPRILSLAILAACAPAALAQSAGSKGIEEVVVTGQKQPYRGDTPLADLPQSITVLDKDLLTSVGVIRFENALDLASGVARQNSFGGLWDSFAIRGFAGDENVPSGYLVNGFNAGRGFSGRRDASNIESIEVLKGPGSALYGRSEPGGTVNIITKKPQFEPEGYLMAAAGSHSTYRLEGDYTGPLSETVAFRINGAYDNAESFRDTVDSEKYTVSPSILASIGASTTLSYELELVDQEAPFDRGIAAVNGDPDVLPRSRFLGEPGDGPMKIEAIGHQLVLQHEINSDWSILAGLGYRDSSFEGYSSDAELTGSRQLLAVDGHTLTRQRRYRDYQATDKSARVEITGKLSTGPVTHHLLFGADTYDFELDQVQNRYRAPSIASGLPQLWNIDVFDPVYGQAPPPLSPLTDTEETQDAYGVYVQDQMDLGERWKLLLGFRFDDFNQEIENNLSGGKTTFNDTATNPRVGLVFQASDAVSVYASYSEGFRPNSGSSFAGDAFEPEESESYEIGAKLQSADGRYQGTIALFHAEKTNVLTSDPINAGFSVAVGEAESEGVELDFAAQLTEGLRLWIAYAYVDAQTSKDILDFNFGVPLPAGTPLINIPEHSGTVTLIQDFHVGARKASVGFSANYVDERLGETSDPSYTLPDYTLVKVFGSVAVTEHMQFMLDVDNLLDEEYYPSSYAKMWTFPGADRQVTAKLKYTF